MSKDVTKEFPSASKEFKEEIIKPNKRWWKNSSVLILTLLVVFLFIKIFIFSPFYIPSPSMEPTLLNKDVIIVNKIIYYYSEPSRGDIIVFNYPLDPLKKTKLVKRIIGLPGETIAIKNNKVYINGQATSELYITDDLKYEDFGPKEIPTEMYFVMGDNRNNSLDSRKWGLLDKRLIIGKADLIIWPLQRIIKL